MTHAPHILLYAGLGLLIAVAVGFGVESITAIRRRRRRRDATAGTSSPRPRPLTEIERFRRLGRRIALIMSVVLLVIAAEQPENHGWEAAVIFFGLMIVPIFAVGFSLAHSTLMWLFRLRGTVASTVVAVVLGALTAVAFRADPISRFYFVTAGSYGLVVG